MPVITKGEVHSVFAGMKCDVCGEVYKDVCFDFVLRYTFGYGTQHDGDSVEAAICDHCLAALLKEHVPETQWTPAG